MMKMGRNYILNLKGGAKNHKMVWGRKNKMNGQKEGMI
jgi:hypothetical protein